MTTLFSSLLSQAGFNHGFGTRGTTSDEYPDSVHILKQVHGKRIVVLNENPESRIQNPKEKCSNRKKTDPYISLQALPAEPFRFDEGDALVTDIPGVSIGIRTADCLPVLMADKATGAVAAIHCGWQGLALGLAGKGVRALCHLTGSDPDGFISALGPSIGPCCYEVGSDVRNAFTNSSLYTVGLFEIKDNSLCLNLHETAKAQLVTTGLPVGNIELIGGCTMCDRDLFWSYRGGDGTDRMISWITAR